MFSPQAGRNDAEMSGGLGQGAQLVMAAPIPQPNFDLAAQASQMTMSMPQMALPQMSMPQMSVPQTGSFSMEALTMALSPLHSSMSELNNKLDKVAAQLGTLERRIDLHQVRIASLEEAMNNSSGFTIDPSINQKHPKARRATGDCQ